MLQALCMQPQHRHRDSIPSYTVNHGKPISTKKFKEFDKASPRNFETSYLDKTLSSWTNQPFVKNSSDVLKPGSSMTDLNSILSSGNQI